MKKIENGVYEMDGGLIGSPTDLNIVPYVMTGIFGLVEREEAAARILTHSQNLGKWVGVSSGLLMNEMAQDIDNCSSNNCPASIVLLRGVPGMNDIAQGVLDLVDLGYLRVEEVIEEIREFQYVTLVYVPTPLLISRFHGQKCTI